MINSVIAGLFLLHLELSYLLLMRQPHLFSSERGPDAVRPDSIRSCTWVQALLRVRRTSNSGRLPGSGGKVMRERSEKRFLHHFSSRPLGRLG